MIGGSGNIYVAHVAKLLNKPSIIFTNNEHAKLQISMLSPFANAICTPSCFKKNIGRNQVRYNGYHELAYLHPSYFKPNPKILDELDLSKDDKFIILRFVEWNATHDIGRKGLDLEFKLKLAREMEKYAKVFITSESKLDKILEKYKITISPEKIHDLLFYATLLYGESATMASECAVLGTHAVFNDFTGRGYTDEEEEKYGLVFNFRLDKDSQRKSLEKVLELLQNNNLNREGKKKEKNL